MNDYGARDGDRSKCPDRDELSAFSLGKLDEEALQRVGVHLEACQRCESTLLGLEDGNDTMICQLRGVGSAPAYHENPAYQEFERRICSIRLGGTQTVPAPEKLPEQLGPYRILEPLGEGGMGAVYRAKHVHLGREVALKILPRDRSHDRRYVNRFHAEMEAIGRLDHPHVVRALDAGVLDRFHFLAMEYVAGTDVSTIVSGKRQLRVADACKIVRQAALGLAYIHQHGFVHRDIKPSNLMLSGSGQVKILDLGLALLHHRETITDALTSTNQILGTADYMAPEQGLGEGNLDRRADLYSLGCVLYQLLTGHVPFDGPQYNTTLKKLAAHATDRPPPLRRYRSGLSGDVELVVERMLAKDPRERFASATEVADLLADPARGAVLTDLVRGKPPSALSTDEVAGAISRERATRVAHGRRAGARRPFRTRLLIASLLIGLFAAAGGIAHFLLPMSRSIDGDRHVLPNPDTSAVGPKRERESVGRGPHEEYFELLAPDQVRRTVQYGLLNVEPSPLHWPHSPLSTWHFVPETRQLSVSCDGLGLLSLGKVPPVEGYTFRIDVYQNQWVGGVGVFFGYQPYEDGTGSAWRFHRLELRPNDGRDRAEFPFTIKRSLVIIRDRSSVNRIAEVSLGTAPVKPMARERQLLEIGVRGARLVHIRWAGTDLHELCTVETNARFARQDYFGQFGLYCYASDAVICSASITVF